MKQEVAAWLEAVQRLSTERSSLLDRLGLVDAELLKLMPVAAPPPEAPAPTVEQSSPPRAIKKPAAKAKPRGSSKGHKKPAISRPCATCLKPFTTNAYAIPNCPDCRKNGAPGAIPHGKKLADMKPKSLRQAALPPPEPAAVVSLSRTRPQGYPCATCRHGKPLQGAHRGWECGAMVANECLPWVEAKRYEPKALVASVQARATV